MSVLEATPQSVASTNGREPIVNDFVINVATANGTGSQTSNMTILRALFKMGIPVNGKNLFPSNIQGLPTWFQIRVCRDGYVARKDESAFLVAFNQATLINDIQELPSGGVCVVPEEWRGVPDRDDIIFYRIPVNPIIRETGTKGRIKEYLTNMVYVGALASILGIDMALIDAALMHNFNNRRKLVEQNMSVIQMAFDWTEENIEKVDPFSVEPMDATAGKILITGNESAGLGALVGGVSFIAWYPITPSTSVVDAINGHRATLRDEDSLVIVQAEDELAAIGMVVGAGWAGGRSMTATSGPGVSLMAEFAGLAYFAEVPAVIWNIQRVGPSTGLPTRTGQGDVTFSYYLGHGDTKNVLLFPATTEECFAMGTTAFNLAEELQTLVLVLSDLDLGMNYWMTEPFTVPDEPIKRGKVLSAEQVEELGFARYRDIDGDGIPYRTLPGTDHPRAAYFARGTGHNDQALYSERPQDWLDNMARLVHKFDTAREMVPAPIVEDNDDANVGIIYYGTTWPAIMEARDRLSKQGIETATLRLRALPINGDVRAFVERYDRVYVIEMNRDGQMHMILQSEMADIATKMTSIAYQDGLPLTAGFVTAAIKDREEA
jgi:2-oxoglutarate ferredoxin oxidoreductase subunit alpha